MNEKVDAESLQVLLVEDNPTDALLLEDALDEVRGVKITLTLVKRLDEAIARLGIEYFDAVLLDLGLPDSSGLETFTRTQNRYPGVPILILSGLDDETLALTAVRDGAQDYLVKGKLDSIMLGRTIRHAIERKRTARQLVESELGYRQLFETVQDGIFILNGDTGQVTDVNPYLEKLLGYPKSGFLGKRLWETPPFRHKGANQAAFRTLQETGHIRYENLLLTTGDGGQVNVEFASNVYSVGDRHFIQCNLHDITQSQLAEAALHAEIRQRQQTEAALHAEMAHRQRVEAESERFFNLSLDNLCVVGFDGFFKRLNPEWELSLGYSCEELMARPYLDFVHPDDLESTSFEASQFSKGLDKEFFQNRFRCKDGSYKWLAWHVKTVPGEELVYASARDITASKKAEQILNATMLQLERSNWELQQFASIASHDLQEPLRAIQAFGERLQSKHGAQLSEEASDYLTRMQSAAGRMRSLIQDLLAYSRVTTKVAPFIPVNLAATARSILSDLAIRLEETQGRVEVGELPQVEADPRQMRQLFQNLIDNGLKFHREDIPPLVRIYAQPLGRQAAQEAHAEGKEIVQIVVEDNGIGLDEKYGERIFSPFERLHNQSKYSGTGIGLAICRKIAERHGGSISVESAPGQGSKFLIVLPVQQPDIITSPESAV